jgi:nicotinamidase-related amidase
VSPDAPVPGRGQDKVAELDRLLDPAHTALVINECQEGVLGARAAFPALAEAAGEVGLVEHIGSLLEAARRAGVTVVHSLVGRRWDNQGSNRNARLFAVAARSPHRMVGGTELAATAKGIDVVDTDIVITRIQGLSPMTGTELDPILRNLGCSTIVVAGLSLNVAVTNLAFEAVNRGYHCVLPRDAVAGVPRSYADQVIDYTLAMVTTLSDTGTVADSWRRSTR